jgi:sucrose-6-phosphate hydrolase SacC (GH32 family)
VRSLDLGSDFYAAQSWSDAPHGRRVWLAWMSHWAYGRQTPTSPWRGMMSLPRDLALRSSGDAIELTQQPAAELRRLRRRHAHLADARIDDASTWLRESGIAGTALEIAVDFALTDGGEAGVKVRAGAAEETVIGIDPGQGQVFVDRGRAGDQSFSPRFDDRHVASLPSDAAPAAAAFFLRIFVDAYSVEVFAGDGRVVMSDLIFPRADSTGVSLFGQGRVRSLDVWTLA